MWLPWRCCRLRQGPPGLPEATRGVVVIQGQLMASNSVTVPWAVP